MKVKMPDSRNKVQLHSIILSQNGTELPDCNVIIFFWGGGFVTLPEIDERSVGVRSCHAS